MSKKEYEFTSGQLWTLYNCVGMGSGQNIADMSKRLGLLAMTEFTPEEKAAIEFRIVLGAPGQPDGTRFKNDVLVTRRFTSGQRKKLIEMALEALPQLRTDAVNLWLWPALVTLKHTLPEPDWDDDDEEDTEP